MVAGTTSTVFINEIHYDNAGSDVDELIEIANIAGIDLTGWTVLLYNGNGGGVYGTATLTGNGQFFSLSPAEFAGTSSFQNGAPDGVALIDADGNVVQFLSYEGTLTATAGAANGLTSTDIGVSETSGTLVGTSLQLTGTGSTAGDFTWASSATATAGAVNNVQTLETPSSQTTIFTEDFDGFRGLGFAPEPAAGQLDSDFFFLGRFSLSDGDLLQGGTGTSGDFARGTTAGGVSEGGIYALEDGSDYAVWVQPTPDDFNSGSITIEIVNTGPATDQFEISYDLLVLNDSSRSQDIELFVGNSASNLSADSDFDFATPAASDGLGIQENQISGIVTLRETVQTGESFFISIRAGRETGSGTFDEFGIDNLEVKTEEFSFDVGTIFINEINYLTAGSEPFEFVELAGEAGLNLTGYLLVFYDGETGAEYSRTGSFASLSDEGNGFGTRSFTFNAGSSPAIQDGRPDGIALVDGGGTVLQFLSYGGSFTAVDGPAAGMTSTDIGVEETVDTPEGFSLQLTGTGEQADDFTWVVGTESRGAFNDGQSFGPPPQPGALSIADATILEGDSGTTNLEFTVTRTGGTDGAVSVDYSVAPASGNTVNANDFDGGVFPSGTVNFADGESSQTITIPIATDDIIETDERFEINLADPTGGASIDDGTAIGTILNDDFPPQGPAEVFINEIHYDNSGADIGEGIEIAGPAGTDLSGWQLALYNGNGGVVYATENLTGIIPDQDDGFGTLGFPISGIQNGPDAIALVNPGGQVVQFLSYEGSVTATDGPAAGQTSEDIGVSEGGVPAGTSLQLGGTGNVANDFTWQPSQTDNFGLVNTGQDFTPANPNGAFYVDDASVVEGDSGSSQVTFNVFRVGGSTGEVEVDVFIGFTGIGFGNADTSDFTGPLLQSLTFADGETLKTATFQIQGDTNPEPNETFVADLLNPFGGATIGDGQALGTILNDDPLFLAIGQIQAASHTSPFVGNEVTTSGTVTAVATNGFYIQDAGDGDSATSDGIFVFTGDAPTVVVQESVEVTGTVSEFQGGGDPANLTITQLTNPSIVSFGQAAELPAALVIGPNGVTPPTEVIEDDDFTSFDPLTDGIDFWESLEGMLVTIENPVAVDSTNGFGELWTVTSDGAGNLNGTNVSDEGLLVIDGGDGDLGEFDAGAGSDFNPERVQIDSAGALNGVDAVIPDVTPGTLLNDVTGIVDYAFENYQVRPLADVTVAQASTNIAETTALVQGAVNQLSVATYNVLNLDINPADGDDDVADGRFAGVATDIGVNLAAPDIVVLQEVQDDSGSASDGTTSARMTLEALATEIFNQTGIQYSVLDNPFVVDGETGGQPGGNIRVAFLYRDDRVDLDNASVFTITEPDTGDLDAAFSNSRAPLGANFTFNGQTVTVIGNHFSSKIGSDSSFSAIQPPTNAGALSRAAQAAAVNAQVDALLAANPDAQIVVTGDLNEFQFEEPLEVLTGELDFDGATVSNGSEVVLENLTFGLDEDDRFSVLFQGNAQQLDHILVTGNLAENAQIDAVHTNTPIGNPNSDHDPILALFNVGTQDITGTNQFDDTLDGNDGDDEIDGLRGDDTINGNGGNDDIDGGRGEDMIDGGDGDDMIDAGADDDNVMGGAGEDMIDGGDGDDMLDGGDDNDKINGDRGNDTIMGGDGDDMLDGGRGDDTIFGGDGNDMIMGGAQGDMLFGEAGDDILDGGAREDELDGGAGMDTLTGGTQADLFILHADGTAADADTITDFERNIDSIRIDGSMGRTITFMQVGPDVQILSDGVLVATVLNASDADVQAASLIDGGGLTLQGDRFDNTLTGGAMDDLIFGDRGNDIIDGMGGDDTIDAGPGDDNVMGGAGDDTIIGGDGVDTISGGDDADDITGNRGNDILNGDGGDDTIDGGFGDDTLNGGAGMDTLLGGAQRDTLNGGANDDILDGGAREDELDGGTGMDMLTGGTQSDLFILHADQTAADADTITDFERNLDTIRIDGAGGKAITFTQVGGDTVIEADGVLVATVLNATSADVLAQTSFDAPPASSMSQAGPGAVTQIASTASVMLSDLEDAPFVFNDAASAPITTANLNPIRVPLTEMFEGIPEPAVRKFMIDGIDEEDNPWLEHGSFGFEPIA